MRVLESTRLRTGLERLLSSRATGLMQVDTGRDSQGTVRSRPSQQGADALDYALTSTAANDDNECHFRCEGATTRV